MALVVLEERIRILEIISVTVTVMLQLIGIVIVVMLVYFAHPELFSCSWSDCFAKYLQVTHLIVGKQTSFVCQMTPHTQSRWVMMVYCCRWPDWVSHLVDLLKKVTIFFLCWCERFSLGGFHTERLPYLLRKSFVVLAKRKYEGLFLPFADKLAFIAWSWVSFILILVIVKEWQ